MSGVAIRVEGLGKEYRIGKRQAYKTLRETVNDTASAPLRWMRSLIQRSVSAEPAGASDRIWALKNLSFDVPRGAVVGIIGRNGAGKSTLLKILSRITEPTTGRVEIHGRVGSLLEVGTGFHPELTGRENVFLNGAILGMRKSEIARQFDEIVDFAGVDKFIDTPVKHFSSGMYLRLAFAIAAHLDPEILIVDEVLAVGDAEFQQRCLGKMSTVAKQGRTVLFVSHSMPAITSLCQSAILLSGGEIAFRGNVASAVNEYLLPLKINESEWVRSPSHAAAQGACLHVQQIRVSDSAGWARTRFAAGEDITVRINCQSTSMPPSLFCVVLVRTASGVPVLHVMRQIVTSTFSRPDGFELTCSILDCPLYPGEYVLSVWIGRNAYQEIDHVVDALTFTMDQGQVSGVDFDLSWRHGLCHCNSEWTVEQPVCSA